VAYLAVYKLGAIALLLSTLFGPEALDYRLRDAGAQVVVTDAESLDRVLGVRDVLLALRHIICVDRADADGILDYQRLLTDASDAFSRSRRSRPRLHRCVCLPRSLRLVLRLTAA
jgi:acetyl-CoA synthetase